MSNAEPDISNTLRDEAEPQLRDLLLFVAGDRTFGIFSDEVESTAEAKHPTPLPLAPAAVLGIVYVRGRMLTLNVSGLGRFPGSRLGPSPGTHQKRAPKVEEKIRTLVTYTF